MIGELAERAKVHVETLRYYERRSLSPAYRDAPRITGGILKTPCGGCGSLSGRRSSGSLKHIKELLSLRTAPAVECGEIRRHAEAKIKDIDVKIHSLTAMKSILSTLVAECSGAGPLTECPILSR
jgi:MerR family copper efflux transcriptional regulator